MLIREPCRGGYTRNDMVMKVRFLLGMVTFRRIAHGMPNDHRLDDHVVHAMMQSYTYRVYLLTT